MLKIKDGIDLKELEKFGFSANYMKREYRKKVYLENDDDDKNFYVINGMTREIELKRLDGEIDDTLYDLIQARISRESRGVDYEQKRKNMELVYEFIYNNRWSNKFNSRCNKCR